MFFIEMFLTKKRVMCILCLADVGSALHKSLIRSLRTLLFSLVPDSLFFLNDRSFLLFFRQRETALFARVITQQMNPYVL